MTDRAQFEAMLEALINEDQETAKEIFHNIVVAKSREIYEELLAEDFDTTSGQPGAEEPAMEEFGAEEDEEGADDFGGEDEEGADDEEGAEDEFGGEEEGEDLSDEEQTDRILDLEDALEELKAEFEQLMAGEEGEDHMGGDEFGGDEFGADEFGGEEELEAFGQQPMFEYVNTVGGKTYDKFGKMGDNGVNTKSAVAGKNDMGGTTANIAQSFSTEKGGTEGGLAKPKAGDLTSGLGQIHNRVDSKAGKTAFKKKEPGHGAEKKGAAPQEDKGAGSLLNGVKSRAK